MALATQDPDYTGPPPYTSLPDVIAGWFSLEMVGCNTIRNTMPFLGLCRPFALEAGHLMDGNPLAAECQSANAEPAGS